jgi:hypothetical protein
MEAVERFLKQKMELQAQQKSAPVLPTSSSKPKLRTAGKGQIKVTTPSNSGVKKRSLLGEFASDQKMRNTIGSINNVDQVQEEQLRRKTVGGGGREVAGINIAAAQEFQYQEYTVNEEEEYQKNGPRVSISSKASGVSSSGKIIDQRER